VPVDGHPLPHHDFSQTLDEGCWWLPGGSACARLWPWYATRRAGIRTSNRDEQPVGWMESGIAAFVSHLFTSLGYGGIVVAMAIESCCIPLPSELIMPLAGFLAFQHKFNIFGATVAGAAGCVVGSAVAYWIGATGGRPLLLRYGRYVLISHHDADRADAYFARYGDTTIFATRLMPIVRTFISLPAGIARMHFGKFVAYTF